MAILTASGRAALAAAIKQQTLHLARGLGEPGWDTNSSSPVRWFSPFNAFEHFLLYGRTEGRSASPLFDPQQYLANNPDLAEAVANGQVNPLEHLLQYGVGEGRNLGNGVSLSLFANDPSFMQALNSGNAVQALIRVETVVPFLPTFQPPPGWAPPANTPIPVDFVPPAGSGISLVVPEGVVVPPGVTLPPVFLPTVPSSPPPAPTVPVAPTSPGSVPVAPATPVPQPDSDDSVSPRFDVSMDDQGVVTFGGDAAGDILLSVSNGLASFTRGGTAAQTIIDLGADTFRNIVLAQDQVLVASAAALDGLAIEGGGLVRVTGFGASTQADLGRLHQELTVQLDIDTTTDVSGQTMPAGLDIVKVAPDAVVTLTALQADGRRIIGEGDVVITASGQAQQIDIATTGINSITAGQGGDQIMLGDGVDVVVVGGGQAATYETSTVTFNDLARHEGLVVGGLYFRADYGETTASALAQGFANLNAGAGKGNTVQNGVWAGVWLPPDPPPVSLLDGFGTGPADGSAVTFTSTVAGNVADLSVSTFGKREQLDFYFYDSGLLKAGDAFTLGGLTLTATHDISGPQVAAAFQDLNAGATAGNGNYTWSGQFGDFKTYNAVDHPINPYFRMSGISTVSDTNVENLVTNRSDIVSVVVIDGVAPPPLPQVITTQGQDTIPSDSYLGTDNSLADVDTINNFTIGQDTLRLLDNVPLLLDTDMAALGNGTGDNDITVTGVSNGVVQLNGAAGKTAVQVIAAILTAAGTHTFATAVVHENDTFLIQADGVAGVQESDVVVKLAGVTATDLGFIEFSTV